VLNHPDMKKTILAALGYLLLVTPIFAANHVLIVPDEFPAMEHVAAKLQSEENVTSQLVWQTNLPPDLSGFSTVLVYIHRGLDEKAEKAFIAYTQSGGKLIVLHHSISSGKRKNKDWFKFLGVTLPEADVDTGGYKWIEGVTQQIVNLAPEHFITTHKVVYPEQVAFKATTDAQERTLPGVTLKESEVYINHVLAEDKTRTRLLGFKYTDKNSGKTYMQTQSGWVKPSGKGWIVYLQPGHSLHDLKNPAYERIVLNAVVWKP
jgi:hypothetical protein